MSICLLVIWANQVSTFRMQTLKLRLQSIKNNFFFTNLKSTTAFDADIPELELQRQQQQVGVVKRGAAGDSFPPVSTTAAGMTWSTIPPTIILFYR